MSIKRCRGCHGYVRSWQMGVEVTEFNCHIYLKFMTSVAITQKRPTSLLSKWRLHAHEVDSKILCCVTIDTLALKRDTVVWSHQNIDSLLHSQLFFPQHTFFTRGICRAWYGWQEHTPVQLKTDLNVRFSRVNRTRLPILTFFFAHIVLFLPFSHVTTFK